MNDDKPAERQAGVKRAKPVPVWLLLTCVLAGTIGYAVGSPLRRGQRPPTDLAVMGFALQQPNLELNLEEGLRLQQSVDRVRAQWPSQQAGVLGLVIALRLAPGGEPDWELARELCAQLKWPRCDLPALRELQIASRP